MIDDALRTQAALYALDALPADEAAAFRAQIAETPGLAEILADYEKAGGAMGESVPEVAPPPGLRDRVLAAAAPQPAATPAAAAPAAEHKRIVWLPWALAAGFAFATGALWVEHQRITTENVQQRIAWIDVTRDLEQANATNADKDRLMATINQRVRELTARYAELAAKNDIAEMQVATLTSKLNESYLASIAWNNDTQEGILHVRRLPAAGEGKDYQLWVIDPGSAAPISAGVFTVQPDGSATLRFSPTQKVSAASAFAVSLEKTGGSRSAGPEGPVVLSN